MLGPLELKRIFTGSNCGNNCTGCAFAGTKRGNRPADEIRAEIENAGREGFGRLLFCGGDPLLRADLGALADFARARGFGTIGVETNGREFFRAKTMNVGGAMVPFDKAAAELIGKLNYFSIKVAGHSPKMHDATTGSAGSFHETMLGLECVRGIAAGRAGANIFIMAKVIATKGNYASLPEIAEFVSGRGVDGIVISARNCGIGHSEYAPYAERAIEAAISRGIWAEEEAQE